MAKNNGCPTRERLEHLLEEKLGAAEHALMAGHVEMCSACQAVLEQLTTGLSSRLGGLAPDGVSSGQKKPAVLTVNSSLRSTDQPPSAAPNEEAGPASLPVVPGYDLLGELGHGGMGVVYKAREHRLNRLVALKMIRPGSDPSDAIRFRTEAEAVARLHHANIVQIYEIGEVAGLPFLSLELLEERTLDDRLAGTPQPARPAALLLATLARAIHAAHQAGIVHRDLKPSNILFQHSSTKDTKEPEENKADKPSLRDSSCPSWIQATPKITDFGLAKRLEQESGQTRTGQIMGSPPYMAPEQARGHVKEIGPAADVYSLGVILYEMLTGRPPFKGPTVLDTLDLVLRAEPVPPSRLQPQVPRDLETICLKCLQKEAHKRYASAEALAADLDRYLAGEAILARRTPAWERALKWARRRPASALALAVSTAAAVGLVAAGLWYQAYVRERARLDEARVQVLRDEGQTLLLEGQQALARQDLQTAQVKLSSAQVRIQEEPRLAPLQDLVQRALDESQRSQDAQRRQAADQERYHKFRGLRNDALFHASRFTGPELSTKRQAMRQAAEAALALFAAPQAGADWQVPAPFALAPLPATLPAGQHEEIRTGCYELLLVMAEAVAPPAPTSDGAAQRQALAFLEDAARLRGSPTRAYHLRRKAYLSSLKNEQGAAQAEEQAKALEPADAVDHFLTGLESYNRKHLAEAVPQFQATLRLQPDHFWAQFLLAICYFQTQRPIEAQASATICVDRRPEFIPTYLLRGVTATERGAHLQEKEAATHFAAAEADFQKALELKPDPDTHYILLVDRSVLRQRQQRFTEAIADLQNAIQLQPGQVRAHLELASAYQDQKQWDAARAQLTEALRLEPDLDPRYPNLLWANDHTEQGRRLHREGQYDKAVQAYDAALKRFPAYPEAQRLRVWALLELKRYDDVCHACDAYLAKGERAAEFYEVRGLARAGREDFAGAIEDYSRALVLQPGSAAVHAHRGWAYVFSDAPKPALADFDKALQLDEDNAHAYTGRGHARVLLGEYRLAVADADWAIRLGQQMDELLPRQRTFYNAARILALAAVAVEADRKLRDLSRSQTRDRYERRAQQLLRNALELLPGDPQRALWRTIETDRALAALRRRPEFAQLGGRP